MRKNTLQRGSVRYIVFKDVDTWFAVGLEFNIVEEGSTPQEAQALLAEAIRGYIESARKAKIRVDAILNQKPDIEYEKMWRSLTNKELGIPYSIASFGRQSLAHV